MILWLFWCLVVLYISVEQTLHSTLVSARYDFQFVASSLINEGDLVYDVNSGYGEGFKLMGIIVGLNGSVISIEHNNTLFEALKKTAVENNFLERTLILNSNPGDFIESVKSSTVEQNAPITLDDIHFTLGGNMCASLMRIVSGVMDEGWMTVYKALIGSETIIKSCRPMLLLENLSFNINIDMRNIVIDLLSSSYDIYRHVDFTNTSEQILLALPFQTANADSQRRFSIFGLIENSIFSVEDTGLNCVIITRIMNENFMVKDYSNNFSLPMEFPRVCSTFSHEIVPLIASGSCFSWTRRYLKDRNDGAMTFQDRNVIWCEHVYSLCNAFTTFRLEFFNRILGFRSYLSPVVFPIESSTSIGRFYAHYENRPDGIVGAMRRKPFEILSEPDVCSEPVWCAHSVDMQRRIRSWQFPDEQNDSVGQNTIPQKASCTSSKFLVFEPPSNMHGIGSLLQVTAAAFRYAVCLDRILVLSPWGQQATLSKWRHPGCDEQSTFECYFESVHGCSHVLSREDVEKATNSTDGHGFDRHPTRDERVLVLRGLPLAGDCQLCHSSWPTRSRFFDGLFVGGVHELQVDSELLHATAFMSPIKLTYISQFLRFLMRPRAWFADLISDVVQLSMYSPADGVKGSMSALLPSSDFPRQYASLHVRFGMKAVEVTLQPLTRYMAVLQRKLPWIRDVFVSTETESVIESLVREYPEYRFHYLRYRRLEYLDLNSTFSTNHNESGTDFVTEFILSMANLYVSSEADGFVGTLSSNWCTCIHHLERSRGDGGFDYLSVDGGSAFTTCF